MTGFGGIHTFFRKSVEPFDILTFINSNILVEFPFEFRALEVALEGICSFLDARTRELETATYPALDELTSKVDMLPQLTIHETEEYPFLWLYDLLNVVCLSLNSSK